MSLGRSPSLIGRLAHRPADACRFPALGTSRCVVSASAVPMGPTTTITARMTISGRPQEPEGSRHRSPLDDGELNRSSGSCFCQVASGLSTPGENQPPIAGWVLAPVSVFRRHR